MDHNRIATFLQTSKRLLLLAFLIALLPVAAGAEGDHAPAPKVDTPAARAFETLKSMAGTWDSQDAQRHEIKVSASGTVVMETMAPDTDYEMINMYFLDGERLLLTHYCSSGNQPQMELQPQESPDVMTFDFVGGTNLDPKVDGHIHAAKLVWVDKDNIESHWTGYKDGEVAHEMVFHLKRHGG